MRLGHVLRPLGSIRSLSRIAILVLALYGAALLVLQYTPLPDWLMEPLVVRADLRPTNAIVLMAAWSSEDGLLNDPGIRRTLRAANLYKAHVAPVVLVSGRNRSASGPTARVMADLLIDLGVPRDAIVLETDSFNTHESAVNVARIAKAKGWTLTIVSEGRDMRRALSAYRHEGATVYSGADNRWDLRTEAGSYRLAQFSGTAHEWLGLAYYWWNGWI
jgi:uncharacterized SAM-binding protein YcdF (DUF218 family)